MNQNIFVNEAINEGIKNYLENNNSEEFVTVIIKTLISIYGELDIINPYKTNTESGMGGFDENIIKFGYSREELSLFKQNVMNFYLTKNDKPNKYFNEIEKQLIDMFYLKYSNIDKDKIDIEAFKNIIQFENTSLNELYSDDKKEIRRYFSYKEKMFNSNFEYKIIEENMLNKEAYEFLGYSYDNIIAMSEEQIAEINNKVFEYFKIDQSRDDKYIRLDQAIKYYKEFPELYRKKGNGHVEFLLLSVFISISLLVVTVIVGVLTR